MTKRASFLLALCAFGCGRHDDTAAVNYVYEIPADFKGWVRVDFDEVACPALPELPGGRKLVRVSSDGLTCTSSKVEHKSWSDSKFVRVGASREMVTRADVAAREIWLEGGAIEECSGGKRPYEVFFVGSEAERKKASDPPSCPDLMKSRG